MTRLWWLSCLALVACGGGLERVSFVTDQLSYPLTGRVMVTLTNTSGAPVGVNVCLSRLVKEDGVTVGPADGTTCQLSLQRLEPGAKVEVRKQLPTGLMPGKWRYATEVELVSTQRETALTPVFTVAP